ncbi:MAG: HAD family hydrolase [Desulfobacterales bacterium]|jgi:HAD superfamily hydrolase (TIGR01509 family)|nr:HAD family hydrolase [Desulfobacterales bacterium]
MEGLIKVIAFDCDGVMFDTVAANKAYYNDILAHFGRPSMTSGQFDYTQMHTADQAITYLFKDPASIAAAHEFRKKSGYHPYIQYMKMDPDLIPLLEAYQGRYGIAVATNRSDTMQRVLVEHGIARYFDLVVTALDVARPKPYPDPLVRVLQHFNIAPHEAIYIGDSTLDQAAARTAGIPFVACRNPDLNGDFHIDRLAEIDDILTRFHG